MTVESSPAMPPVVRIGPPRPWSIPDFRELWAYRELAGFLIWRDLKVRYKQTMLGVTWAVIQPLLTMVIFSVIFGRLADLPSEGVPYPIFTLAALLPWQLFAGGLAASATSLVGSAGLVTKVYFPRLVIPMAATLVPLVDFLIASLLLLAMLLYYGIAPSAALLTLPLFILLALTTAFAVGLWLSALNVRYRDVQHAVPFMMQVWLFATPVAYSLTLVPDSAWRTLYALNPMVVVVQGFRWALVGGVAQWSLLPVSLAVVFVLLGGGLLYFRQLEDRFADVI